jgi:hypothetical protein
MKKTGIWIDKRQAKIVHLGPKGEESFKTLISEVEEMNPIGGSGSPAKGGPQDVVQDSKFTEREKHQLKRFFASLAEEVDTTEQVVVFGPGQTGGKLKQEWKNSFPKLAERLSGVEKADSMTDNQVKAWVRNYFEA